MANTLRRPLIHLSAVVVGTCLVIAPGGSAAGAATDTTQRSETNAAFAAAFDLGWFSIGGPYLPAAPQVVPQGDVLFQLAQDGSAWAHERVGGAWSGPIALGGLFNSVVVPTLALNEPPPPEAEAFGVGLDDALWYRTMSTDWQSLGGALIFDPTPVRYQGVTYIFGVGTDGAVWYRSLTSGWFTIGGFLDSTLAATTDGTNLYITGVGGDGAMWSAQLSPSLTWSGWQPLGGQLLSYPVATFLNDTGYLFSIGLDDAVWYAQVTAGVWSGWQSLGGFALTPPAAVTDAGGGVGVFVIGGDLAMYSQRLGPSGWSGWQDLGGAFIAPPGASQSQAFGIGLDAFLWVADNP